MTSFGRVAIGAVNVAQEAAVSLAHLNFDFSLIKWEAPAEYSPLGKSLSQRRKLDAEDGKIHVTARQLGQLFTDDLPEIPNLSKAYGLRVSEIAEIPRFNPRGAQSDGALADYIGADGTSIWAAATSGSPALAAHLLACLLARIWSPPQAISIWSELVDARKALLEKRFETPQYVRVLMASKIEIARERLAEWDASARSVSNIFSPPSLSCNEHDHTYH